MLGGALPRRARAAAPARASRPAAWPTLTMPGWPQRPGSFPRSTRSPTSPARTAWRPSAPGCARPTGAPGTDRQTHLSLRPYLLEEAYETIDAIEHGTPGRPCRGARRPAAPGHPARPVRRGGGRVRPDRCLSLDRRQDRPPPPARLRRGRGRRRRAGAHATGRRSRPTSARSAGKAEEGAFGGVARALPALPASREIQERALALGWDWDAIEGVWEKVAEELEELRVRRHRRGARSTRSATSLFALVNLARWMKLDPEEALRTANHRWVARYRRVEALAAERGRRPGGALAGGEGPAVGRGQGAVTARGRVAIVVHAVVPGDPRVRRQSDALVDAGLRGRHHLPAPAGRAGRGARRPAPDRAPADQPRLRRVRRPHRRVRCLHRHGGLAPRARASAPPLRPGPGGDRARLPELRRHSGEARRRPAAARPARGHAGVLPRPLLRAAASAAPPAGHRRHQGVRRRSPTS